MNLGKRAHPALADERTSGTRRITDSWTGGHGPDRLGGLVHAAGSLPDVFRGRSKQLEEIHQWLGGYLQGVAVMLQLPGGASYEWLPDDADDAEEFIWTTDRDMLFCLLAHALEHLDAKAVMEQVPGGDSYKPRRVPTKFQLKLVQRDGNGVLNLVAICLDRLMVIPELPEEDRDLYGTLE